MTEGALLRALGRDPGARRLRLLMLSAPLLLATFPIVFLAAQNTGEGLRFFQILLPMGVVWAAVTGLTLLANVVLKDAPKSAMVVVVLVSAFYGYGLLIAQNDHTVAGVVIFRGRFLIPATFLATGAALWYVISVSRQWRGVLMWISTASLLAIAFNTFLVFTQGSTANRYELSAEFASVLDPAAITTAELPDIYFFIFDGYGRADQLRTYFDFDNSAFVGSLEDRGFEVLSDSRASYPRTAWSISTTLNMQHIHGRTPAELVPYRRHAVDIFDGSPSIAATNVAQLLRSVGYHIVAYDTQTRDDTDTPEFNAVSAVFSPFSRLLLDVTALAMYKRPFARWWRLGYGPHNLPDRMPQAIRLADDPRPTFAFVHSLPPRPPYTFNRDGSLRPGWETDALREGNRWNPGDKYVDHLIFINKTIVGTVDEILSRSSQDPIIIIQGDHGPATNRPGNNWSNPTRNHLEERTGILNALHLPESCRDRPYSGMTSVNTFRFVLKSCFGVALDLLPDETYWSLTDTSADFRRVFP